MLITSDHVFHVAIARVTVGSNVATLVQHKVTLAYILIDIMGRTVHTLNNRDDMLEFLDHIGAEYSF